jgi:hypothetical protein
MGLRITMVMRLQVSDASYCLNKIYLIGMEGSNAACEGSRKNTQRNLDIVTAGLHASKNAI